jgi:hypothetical protein
MKTLKGWITTTCMLAMIMVSTTAVKADGVIIAGVSAPTSCTTETVQKVKGTDFGVIIAGLTGVIIAGFTGVIIAGATNQPTQNCGVIIAG